MNHEIQQTIVEVWIYHVWFNSGWLVVPPILLQCGTDFQYNLISDWGPLIHVFMLPHFWMEGGLSKRVQLLLVYMHLYQIAGVVIGEHSFSTQLPQLCLIQKWLLHEEHKQIILSYIHWCVASFNIAKMVSDCHCWKINIRAVHWVTHPF